MPLDPSVQSAIDALVAAATAEEAADEATLANANQAIATLTLERDAQATTIAMLQLQLTTANQTIADRDATIALRKSTIGNR